MGLQTSEITIDRANLSAPHPIENARVVYKNSTFFVLHNGQSTKIESHNLSKDLRDTNTKQLKAALGACFISLKKIGGEYTAELRCRGLGGGPITGAIAYWATKSICYAGLAGAAAGTVAATGGAIVAAGGAVAGAAAGAGGAAAAAGASAATVAGTATGVGAAGAGAFAAGAAASAGVVATEGAVVVGTGAALAVAEAGGVAAAAAATVATVESASIGVGAFFTALPFLP